MDSNVKIGEYALHKKICVPLSPHTPKLYHFRRLYVPLMYESRQARINNRNTKE